MSSPRPELKLDWASHAAAKHAVENWHYSRRLPSGGLVKIGVWEAGRFVGCLVYSKGATPRIGSPYGLTQFEVCELTRVALTDHSTPVSRILAISFRMLRSACPGLKLIVSYADTSKGHRGGIYQAGGWVYAGESRDRVYRINGKIEHPRSCGSRYGRHGQSLAWLRANVDPKAEMIMPGPKHRYLMPLDDDMRDRIAPLARPYPKPRAGSIEGDALAPQAS